jgi:hypothetical protein
VTDQHIGGPDNVRYLDGRHEVPPPAPPTEGPREVTHRILVAGSYGWHNPHAVAFAISDWWQQLGMPWAELTTGATPGGAEAMAEASWAQQGMPIRHFPIDDHVIEGLTYESAEDARNAAMIAAGPYDAVFVFIREYSAGAEDFLRQAELSQMQILLLREEFIVPEPLPYQRR